VSEEFTVRVCRVHHRELHRSGDEAAWRQRLNIDPLPVALRLWQHTRADGEFTRSAESTTQVHAAKTPDMSAQDRAGTSRDAPAVKERRSKKMPTGSRANDDAGLLAQSGGDLVLDPARKDPAQGSDVVCAFGACLTTVATPCRYRNR
jgi:hypothetical protein